MLGFFKSKKSEIRRRLEKSVSVHRTWFEYALVGTEDLRKTLVVEVAFDTDPISRESFQSGMDEIRGILESVPLEERIANIRLVPRKYQA